MFDSRSPHPDCRILPAPALAKVTGLSMAQSSARRRIMTNHKGEAVGVLRTHAAGGSEGLGMRSTVASTPRMIVQTRWKYGPKTPGQKNPRSPKPPKQNPVFYSPILKGKAIKRKEAEQSMTSLTRFHLAIMQGRCGVRAEEKYEQSRAWFLKHNPSYRARFDSMEQAHIKRVK